MGESIFCIRFYYTGFFEGVKQNPCPIVNFGAVSEIIVATSSKLELKIVFWCLKNLIRVDRSMPLALRLFYCPLGVISTTVPHQKSCHLLLIWAKYSLSPFW